MIKSWLPLQIPAPGCSQCPSAGWALPGGSCQAPAPAPPVCVPGTAPAPSWPAWIKTSKALQSFSCRYEISCLSPCPGVQVLLPCFCPALILPGYAQSQELASFTKITLLCVKGSFFGLLPYIKLPIPSAVPTHIDLPLPIVCPVLLRDCVKWLSWAGRERGSGWWRKSGRAGHCAQKNLTWPPRVPLIPAGTRGIYSDGNLWSSFFHKLTLDLCLRRKNAFIKT